LDYKNTYNSLFNGNLKSISFNARARKYDTNRKAALDGNNIPESVYENLVNTVEKNLQPLHRWASLKKKVLGLSDLHAYDTYVTLFPATKRDYTYDESKEILLKALKPLGDDYLKSLKLAFENRWIDVFETKGKRSGAYSSGVAFGVHPYVLLNWNNQLNDLFTFAHEMGHNMHSYYTENTQPYIYANYSIFVAEVASTLNEALLLDYLIANARTEEEKLALIEEQLNNMTTTFYRQTRFASFEQWAHVAHQKGEALTPDKLSEKYGQMYQDYWGSEMVVDEEEKVTWARIPHFYYNFYVYQYATSYAASQAIVEKINKEGQSAIDKYLNFLKAGSSKYPIEVLKEAGVDMNSPEPILAVVNKMNELLDQMEQILGK
jgi:oligoendopeptidase F